MKVKIEKWREKSILGDPGADSGGKGKSKRAEKCGTKKSNLAVLYFSSFHIYFSARLDFPSPPLSTPGSPRMEKRGNKYSFQEFLSEEPYLVPV